MADVLLQILNLPGLIWIFVITFIAGVVYGFVGFGAALIFMPVATVFVPVQTAVAAFSVSALISFATLVPKAWKQANKRGTVYMILCASVAAPLGLYVLQKNDLTTMRWAVLLVVAFTLLALMTGWRYRTIPGPGTRAAVGLGAGFLGGSTGLLGPMVIMFQLGGQDSVTRSRANTLVFLTVSSLMMLPFMAMMGMLDIVAVPLGLALLAPYGIGSVVGQWLFIPDRERLYRATAYAIIAAAVIIGLPVYD